MFVLFVYAVVVCFRARVPAAGLRPSSLIGAGPWGEPMAVKGGACAITQ